MNKLTYLVLAVLLLFVTPVWAVPYSGSAQLDWTSLTFSGVSVELIPRFQQQGTYLIDAAMSVREDDGEHGPRYSFPAGSTTTRDDVGFPTITGWSAQTATVTVPQVGTVLSQFDSTSLTAAMTLEGVGNAQSFVGLDGFLVASTSGPLTASIGYQITHDYVPVTSGQIPDFQARSHLQLIVTNHGGEYQAAIHNLTAPTGSSSQSGILSVTQWLTAGVLSGFTLSTSLEVNQPEASSVVSAPEPPTLWLMLLGFMGLAGFVAWRHRRLA